MITLFCIRPRGFNVGNDAIFVAMEHFIYEAFGQVVNLISLPAVSRYESQVNAGLTSRTIHEINQYGHGVIVGGGNLYENGELEMNPDALEALSVPLMLFGLSWGRIYNRHQKLVGRTDSMTPSRIVALNKKAGYSLVRDNATLGHLREIGCTEAKVGGCPTIFINRMKDRLPRLPLYDEGSALVSVRNPSLMNVPLHKQAQVYSDIAAITNALRQKGFPNVRLLCHDYRDIPFAASFGDIEYIYPGDVYTYLAILSSCSLNVSYRLHASLPCLAFNRPTIKISYDERSLSLMETIGFGEWNINMMETDNVVGDVLDRYNRLEELPTIRSNAGARWRDLEKAMADAFDAFARDVKEYYEDNYL
jgi:polysaccharide pyruvyl transferase WcaK-like protein